ncbi:MAG: Na+/H+ antiporter subunit E [Balneolales bacterium]
MNIFLINILLAFIWGTVTGHFSIGNLAVGFILGYIILLISRPVLYESDYANNFWRAIGLGIYFLKELFVSSIRVAVDVVKPGFNMRSGVVAIPLDARTDMEITMLANMISLTPGTLSLDVSDDRTKLYIHAMYIDTDVEAVRKEVKSGMERRLLRVVRQGSG